MDYEIVKIKHLNKRYGDNVVLKDINLTLQRGKIYGFIGENGAGKTTLMRIITGLSKESSGEYQLFGEKNKNINKEKNAIGAIIESPALISELTAYENLKYKMIMNNVHDDSQIERILSEVNLNDAGKKKVYNYSLGMKQRLGIAMALVNKPQLLVLDEPINGLDPTGIIEMRNILKELNSKYGISIFISSHILSEMYQMATDYIFIHKGRIVKELTSQELDSEFSKCIIIETDNNTHTINFIEKLSDKIEIETVNETTIKLYNYDNSTEVTKYLVENGIGVKQIYIKAESLEDYYSSIISKNVVCNGGKSNE